MGGLSRKASRKPGQCSAGRMRGAMPPPMNTPARGEPAERQVASLAAVGRHEERQGLVAPLAAALEPCRGDRGRQIEPVVRRLAGVFAMRQLVQVRQPRAAQHVLDRGAAVLLAQHAHQLVLAPVARGKVRVSALRCAGKRPSADAHQEGLAEARACGDDRHHAIGPRPAGLQRHQVVGVQRVECIRQRLDVIQQLHWRAQDAAGPVRVDHPGMVGQLGHLGHHRSRHAEGRCRHRLVLSISAQELRHGRVERRAGIGVVAALDDQPRPPRSRLEETQQRLGPADVTGQQAHGISHGLPASEWCAWSKPGL